MTNTRMNKLLCELSLPKNSVYIPDTGSILKNVGKKLEKTEKRTVRVMSTSKMLAVAVIVVLMLALSIVAFGKDGVIRKIITIFEEATTEQIATEEVKDVFVPTVVTETVEVPTEIVTEEIETEGEKTGESKYVSPIFDKYHKEEASEVQEYVKDVYGSIEDENYVLTVNEVLGDETNIYMTVTIEAKNNVAKEKLMSGTAFWLDIDAWSSIEEKWVGTGNGSSEIYNLKRENSRSFSVHVFGDAGRIDGYNKIRVTCTEFSENMTDERYVYFEMEESKESIDFELLGQSFTGGRVEITPIGLSVTIAPEETASYAYDARNLNTFFRFKNGSIKSFNQLAGFDTTTQAVPGRSDLCRYETGAKSVIDIESIQSVIVKGIEYPVDNPEGYFPASVPERLKPFVLYDVGKREDGFYYVCNIAQLEPCLDITYHSDDTVEFTYAGKKYSVQSGNFNVIINGKTNYNLYVAPMQDTNGDMWVGMDFINYLLGIRYGEIGDTGTYLFVP